MADYMEEDFRERGGMVGAAGGLRATRQPQLFPVTGQ
jgi:hypothetical protein